MNSLSRLLKESWTVVEEQQDKLASYFYARIFLSNPQVRDLFPIQMDVQRARLLGAIVTAVQTVEDPERFEEYLRALGRDHRSVEYDQAWRDAYDRIARVMIMGADADSENPPYWHAEVISHERRSKDIAVFTCRPLQPLEYRAGQYVSMECKYQPRLWRVYSMANAPRKDGLMEFHIRALGAGWVSSALVWRLKPGDMIRLAAPMGSMVLDRHSTRDIVCVAGGTGLAPIKALVEELTQYNRTRGEHVFFGSGSPAMVKSTLRTLAELQVPAIRIKYDAFGDV